MTNIYNNVNNFSVLFNPMIDDTTKSILQTIIVNGGSPYFVGGCVRDTLMNEKPKDFDVEVFGIDKDLLLRLLLPFGNVDEYGKSFGIIVCNGIEFAIPRTERKVGEKHTDFEISLNPFMSVEDASKRRDFTINSIYYDWSKQVIVDPNNGVTDLLSGMIRHTSNQFSEDVLRVLRAIRFACRFNFCIATDTKDLIKDIRENLKNLPKERIWGEFFKILAGNNTRKMFSLLKELHLLDFFTEIGHLSGCPQDPTHHPEGDVFKHTMFVVDACKNLLDKYNFTDEQKTIVLLGSLCHDFGKPSTTKFVDGKITAHGHDSAGVEPTITFLNKIGCPKSFWDKVSTLVDMHMLHINYTNHTPTMKSVRKLKNKLAQNGITFEMLECVVHSDMNGRPPLKGGLPTGWLKIKELYTLIENEPVMLDGKIRPIVNGDYLISRYAYKQGKELGDKLKELYELQMEGRFCDIEGALQFI